ncbi:chymotrypsin-2 [Frankliniella occidentalis]|uniref:Chymotrypsin-2 n=1 Tax=Frankliniella occidentalis TaxID=133901 RepID=A0A6J1SLK7_FRAOC|nr:chymotrypsin-2 [Frankliniella occidentalis]
MLKEIACLALLAAAAQAFVDNGSARLSMTGGDVVEDAKTYSFQVAIRPRRTQNGLQVDLPVCSGVLILGSDAAGADAYFVLTSATCALAGTTHNIFIGKNEVKTTTSPDVADQNANTAIIHPEFLKTFTTADLAILPIDKAVGAAATSTALLLSVDDTTKSYLATKVKMSGWGYPNDVFKSPSPKLRQISSRVVPNLVCTLAHLGKPISGAHLCTAGLINKGPCTGDSGAPLIVEAAVEGTTVSKVIGIATLTPNNGCSRGRPGVFTKLGSYLPWIQSITNYDVERTQ